MVARIRRANSSGANLANLEFVYGAAMPGELKRQAAQSVCVRLLSWPRSSAAWASGRNFYADENGTMRELSQIRNELTQMLVSHWFD